MLRKPLIGLCVAAVAATSALAVSVSPAGAGRTTSGSVSGCGKTIYKSFMKTWRCTFADNFDSGSLDTSKWTVQQTATSGYRIGPECYVNDADNVSVANGTLNLTVRHEDKAFNCATAATSYATEWTAGMVTTHNKFSQAYGRFEARLKFPSTTVTGVHSAFWLWPDNATRYGAYPASGEIDVAEFYSKYPDRAIPYIHYNPAAPDPNVTNNYCTINDVTQFHTYTVEWTTNSIKVSYDGNVCINDNWNPASPLAKPAPFDQTFFLALTQGLGIGTNSFSAETTTLPATMQIDYVRVWQ